MPSTALHRRTIDAVVNTSGMNSLQKRQEDEKKFPCVNETYKSLCETFNIPIYVPRVRRRLATKIAKRIPINSVDAKGRTLLICACAENKQDIAFFLLDNYEEDIGVGNCDAKGNTALHYACMSGRPSLVARLTLEMVKRRVDLKRANKQGHTPVDTALRYGNAYAADIVIQEVSATRLDVLFTEEDSMLSYEQPPFNANLFVTEEPTVYDEECIEAVTLPKIGRAKRGIPTQTRREESPIPSFDPRKSSKVMCSHLLYLRAMQESCTYRSGFPDKGANRSPHINITEPKRDRNSVSSLSTLQKDARPRTSNSLSVFEGIKPESINSSTRRIRTRGSLSTGRIR